MKAFMRSGSVMIVSMVATLFLTGCAETSDQDYSIKEQRYLDNWVLNNVTQSDTVTVVPEKMDNGMYVQWFDRGAGQTAGVGSWVRVDYTGMTLSGDIFATRDSLLARRVGFSSVYTDYSAYMVQYRDTAYYMNLSEGQRLLIKQMKPGAKAKVYMPSGLANINNLPVSNGFGNISGLSAGPLMFEMSMVEVISKVEDWEKKKVTEYARDNGYPGVNPSSPLDFYIKITDDSQAGETISVNSIFKFKYEGRLLVNDNPDRANFLLDTDQRAPYEAYGRSKTEYKPIKCTIISGILKDDNTHAVDEQAGELISAFRKAIESGKIKYNTEFEMVFTSYYGYGLAGNYNSNATTAYTLVQPYQPLIFKVKVLTRQEAYTPSESE